MATIRLDPERGAELRRLLADGRDPSPDAPPAGAWSGQRPDLWRLPPRPRRWSGVRPVDAAARWAC